MSVVQNPALDEAIRVLKLEGNAILEASERLSSGGRSAEQFRLGLQILDHALRAGGKIVIAGLGKSGKVGQKVAATLSSTGSQAVFLHATEALHGDLGLVSANDAVIAISHSGHTEEVLRLLPPLRKLGVPVIGLGGHPDSALAQQCDAWLDASIPQEACPHNLAPTTSTTLALAIGDAIAVSLMRSRGFDSQDFARNHPGGSLGRRLQLTVGDLMKAGTEVPVLQPDASMEEIVVAISQKGLGAALVVEAGRLVGIVTDGDVRRAVRHREKFFGFRAADLMTRNPVTVTPETRAWDALRLMEDRPSQIKELPVVATDGSCKGVIRLHDLVRCF